MWEEEDVAAADARLRATLVLLGGGGDGGVCGRDRLAWKVKSHTYVYLQLQASKVDKVAIQ